MIVPGISNFVNASVRRSHPRACGSTSQRRHDDGFCDLWGALASRAAGAALGLKRWHGRNKRYGGMRSVAHFHHRFHRYIHVASCRLGMLRNIPSPTGWGCYVTNPSRPQPRLGDVT
jgi:hypothetical protein